MKLIDEILSISRDIEFSKAKGESRKLPGGALFLENGIDVPFSSISLCRFPYMKDGLTLWALQNGKMSMNESNFFYLPENIDGEPNFLAFTLGLKDQDSYFPYALFDCNRNILEKGVARHTVYKDGYCLYFLELESLVYVMRFGISKEKELLMEGAVISKSSKPQSIYTSLYLNPMLMHGTCSSIETKWFKQCEFKDHVYAFFTVEDLSRTVHLESHAELCAPLEEGVQEHITTSRALYCGGKNNPLSEATPLLKGEFAQEKKLTRFSDTAIAGDFRLLELKPHMVYSFGYAFGKEVIHRDLKSIQQAFDELETDNNFSRIPSSFHFHFEGKDGEIESRFFDMLVKQVQYCASCKNSTLSMLGVRDIYQAIESQVPFAPKEARSKMLDCLNYLELGGRSPRQFAHFEKGINEIRVDAREFIDQGLWIIRCLYTYLAYTGDFDLLKEEAGFIQIHGSSATLLPQRSSVLDHIERILGYLISHIDPKTHCLRTLYGDWNDAIDGLGKGEDESSFGDGVSAMATFQLYEAIVLFEEICSQIDYTSPLDLQGKKEELEQGILQNIIIKQGNEYRIVHGWGKNQSFYVGSFDDVDHKSRYALTSPAFYCLSGFALKHPEFLDTAKNELAHLEGKYGFLTFYPPFYKDAAEVGRIVNLPEGTAENGATYIHGALFAADALFRSNEPEWAFREIDKLLPYHHDFVSTTPFVMPNSYIDNPNLGCDGESMSDWFTGSSSTLLKIFLRDVFGLDVRLNEIRFSPPECMPWKRLSIQVCIENKPMEIELVAHQSPSLSFNGKTLEGKKDALNKTFYSLPKSELQSANRLVLSTPSSTKGEIGL